MKKRRLSPRKRNQYLWAALMLAPSVIGLAVLDFWPIIKSFLLSLQKDMGFGKLKWVGPANYERLISDSVVWRALGNTLIYTVLVVAIGVSLSLILAVLLDTSIRAKGLFRTLYFLPIMAAPAAIALCWRWIFNSEYGVLNAFLGLFGIAPVDWLVNKATLIPCLAAVTIWSEIGYNAVILLAGLQSIDKMYYEAALIDGAGSLKRFFRITLPMLSPTLFFVIITRAIFALKQFDISWMMVVEYNPIREFGQTVMHVYYNTAFVSGNTGYASAIVMLTLVVTLIVTIIQSIGEKKWVNYDV